jgi:hypothetical protein
MRWFLIDVVGWLNGVCYRNGFQYSPWESVAAHSIFVRSSIFFGRPPPLQSIGLVGHAAVKSAEKNNSVY